jgi:hypothetical protein
VLLKLAGVTWAREALGVSAEPPVFDVRRSAPGRLKPVAEDG